MIYVLHPVGGGPFKIGCSVTPEGRRYQTSSMFPYGVELLASFEGELIGERYLHRCFAPLCINTEWFRPHYALWRFVTDVIDNGRPSFLPAEERAEGSTIRDMALALFGDPKTAMQMLGYSEATVFKDTFAPRSRAAQAKVMFADDLRKGRLPEYIAALHGPSFALQAAE